MKREIVCGEIYHIYNRGVEKRIIFENEDDYYRFIFCLYECNDVNAVRMSKRISSRLKRNSRNPSSDGLQGETLQTFGSKEGRDKLVEIVAFVLMPNHYHLVLRQIKDGGLALFMKKLGDSYTGYFNKKYERKGMGGLFCGAFKSILVSDNNQFLHLAEYLFSNPVAIIEPEWKEAGAKNPKAAIEFLNNYKWSSYPDTIGAKNFPSVTDREFLWKAFAGADDIEAGKAALKESVEKWIFNKKN